jgi:pimeloyl-ACP methyl ester carboxylesterase
MPFLLFLTGGPGFEAPRPAGASAWVKAAASHFRIVLLDQRGTGRSSPVSGLASLTAAVGGTADPGTHAAYLTHFRADAIVRDAEAVRAALVPSGGPQRGRWSVLGQSFGGFVATAYLSLAPEGLTEVLIAGGLPPDVGLPCAADAVYDALFARVAAQNAKYYARFPGDAARARAVVLALEAGRGPPDEEEEGGGGAGPGPGSAAAARGGIRMPGGGLLTPRAFQALGLPSLGLGGGFERLHWLLERGLDGEGRVTPALLRGAEAALPWAANPLYALLHESIYANGAGPTAWAAARARESDPARASAFDAVDAARAGRPVLFTGEMVFPWMFGGDGESGGRTLARLAPVADALASKADWPALYDVDALSSNRVPVAAAVYYEDMYVDFELSQRTASRMSCLRTWVTNEVGHSAIRDEGGRVFDHLLGLVRGSTVLT